MQNGDFRSGVLTIPAGIEFAEVVFDVPFRRGNYSVVANNGYLYSKKIICSISGITKDSFRVYPCDAISGEIPTVESRFFWIAICR